MSRQPVDQSDLAQRDKNGEMFIDKVTFIEYTKLPGIINDRFHYIFDEKKTGRIY